MSDALTPEAAVAEMALHPVPVTEPAPMAIVPPAAPAPSIRAVVVRNAWRDLRRFSTLFFACTSLLGGFHAVRLRYGDVHDYYAYVGTDAPLSVDTDATGKTVPGHLETTFHPGERVGWMSNFCAGAGHAYTAHVVVVRADSAGPDSVPLSTKSAIFAGDSKRCGPLLGFTVLPPDTVPGLYVVHRHGVFRDGSWWPLRFDLPDFRFTVVPTTLKARPEDEPPTP